MSIFEQLVLDSLALNDRTNFIMQGFDPGIAPKRWQWISGTDSDGAVLPEEANYDNAEMTLRIRIAPQASMNAALAKIGQIIDKLQECEQQSLGLPAVWTPNGSTNSFTAYVLGGEITGIPITLTGDDAGWFLRNPAPVVMIKLYRRPFWYGAEVTNAATVTDTNPVQVLTVSSVTGDVPAEARLVFTDAATQGRRHLEWGKAWRYTPTSALIDSDSLVTSGFNGTGTTRAGAYDPGAAGNSVVRSTLYAQPVAICGTGNQSHIGSYRIKARVFASNATAANTFVRLSWQDGDGAFVANSYTNPPVGNNWAEVDLGIITIPEKILGTQKWSGRIEAYTIGTPGTDTLDVDYIELFPVEAYGKARAIYNYAPGVLVAQDQFTGTTAAAALNTRVAPLGGTWATSGEATDLTFADGPGSGEESLTRAVSTDSGSGRFAVLGATSYTNTEVGALVQTSGNNKPNQRLGVLARYVDSSNYLLTRLVTTSSATSTTFEVIKVIAGTPTTLKSITVSIDTGAWYTLRVIAYTSGRVIASLMNAAATVALASVDVVDTVIATSGTLATGKPGLLDFGGSSAGTRYYDNVYAATPSAEPIVVNSGRAAEIRWDAAKGQDSTGTYYGDLRHRGAHFFLDPAGDENRSTTIVGKLRRNDVDAAADDQIADSTTLTVHYTPRWLAVPR